MFNVYMLITLRFPYFSDSCVFHSRVFSRPPSEYTQLCNSVDELDILFHLLLCIAVSRARTRERNGKRSGASRRSSGAVSGPDRKRWSGSWTERGARVTEIGWSVKRLFRRSQALNPILDLSHNARLPSLLADYNRTLELVYWQRWCDRDCRVLETRSLRFLADREPTGIYSRCSCIRSVAKREEELLLWRFIAQSAWC